MTREQLVKLRDELQRLLYLAELAEPNQPEGAYPSETLMALRLAWSAAMRAVVALPDAAPEEHSDA